MLKNVCKTTFLLLFVLLVWQGAVVANPFATNNKVDLAVTKTSDSGSAVNAGFPCQGNVNCRWCLNVRTGPWGKIIDGYVPGTKVEVVAREGDWYRIKRGSGFAYVHTSLIDVPGIPASGGPNKSPYASASKSKTTSTSKTASSGGSKAKTTGKTGGINGPEIPASLLNGLAAAKQTKWFTTKDKCLQFAGTVVAKAGAKVNSSQAIYPHLAYKPNKELRGSKIGSLGQAALAGKLKPGMLIHVKAAYDKDPAYNPVTNAHHWFVYMGTKNGVPMFADNLRNGRLQTIEEINRNMSAGRILQSQYKPYGNIRRVSAVYDPFAGQR